MESDRSAVWGLSPCALLCIPLLVDKRSTCVSSCFMPEIHMIKNGPYEIISTRNNRLNHWINTSFGNCRCARFYSCINYLGQWKNRLERRPTSSAWIPNLNAIRKTDKTQATSWFCYEELSCSPGSVLCISLCNAEASFCKELIIRLGKKPKIAAKITPCTLLERLYIWSSEG